MSTTVKYKGNTIATLTSETKSLTTSGTWLEDDIELTDHSVGNIYQDEDGYVVLDDEPGTDTVIEPLSVTANGTYTAPTGTAYSPVTVNVSGGGESASKKQINFIDYDGTILHSYTKAEWQNVSALPNNPSHSGLTAQGWNWTKEQIDAQLTAMPDGDVWVGQMYVTDDDKTRLYCRFEEGRLYLYFGLAPQGTVVVDWGDGSATDTLTGINLTALKYCEHTYAQSGDYVITLTAQSGTFAIYSSSIGTNVSTYLLRKSTATTGNVHKVMANALKRVELGSAAIIGQGAFRYCTSLEAITMHRDCTIGTNAFQYCYSLASITIPSGVTSIENYAFNSCSSLASITIPSGVTSIGTNAFQYCYSLASITIPSGVTSIETFVVYNCSSFASITIPSGVTSIGSNAFQNCYGMAEYHFLPTTPPSLAATNAFTSIQSDCIIYVPYSEDHSILEAYQTATNWSTYASYMQEEPQ